MTQRRRNAVRGLAILLLAGGAYLVLSPKEPVYQRKLISDWLDEFSRQGHAFYPDAAEPFSTNILPYVVRNLTRSESGWHKRYEAIWTQLPGRMQGLLPAPRAGLSYEQGAVLFAAMDNATPQLVALTKHRSRKVRQAAVIALGRSPLPPLEPVIPALQAALNDRDQQVAAYADWALEGIARNLLGMIVLQTGIVVVDGQVSNVNTQAVPRSTVPVIKAALQTRDPYLRGQAAFIRWRLDGGAEDAVAVLLHEIPPLNGPLKANLIHALGKMGANARPAIPQLAKMLQPETGRYVLKNVTNAMVRIDADAAARFGVFPP